MVKFSDKHKEDSRGDFIPEGTHLVKIMFAEQQFVNVGEEQT